MPRIRTPLTDIIANDGDSAIFTPMTPALNSTSFKEVRGRMWFDSVGLSLSVAPAVQYSNDGLDFSAGTYNLESYASVTGTGWKAGGGDYADIFGTFESQTPTPRQFVRFGILAKTVGSDVPVLTQARLVLESKPTVGHTMVFGPQKVHTKGDNQNYLFHPLSGPLKTEDMGEVRMTLEMLVTGGDITLRGSLQSTDTPWNPTSWSTFADPLTATRIAAGITCGTTFTTITAAEDEDWIRFGVEAKNTTGSDIEAAIAAVRVDFRR